MLLRTLDVCRRAINAGEKDTATMTPVQFQHALADIGVTFELLKERLAFKMPEYHDEHDVDVRQAALNPFCDIHVRLPLLP